jgi:peptidoglycan/LPS O-acetylase OafA/YrhL
MKYYKTLDSLRAFAVFLVILSHWLPFNFVKVFHFGYVGVDIGNVPNMLVTPIQP